MKVEDCRVRRCILTRKKKEELILSLLYVPSLPPSLCHSDKAVVVPDPSAFEEPSSWPGPVAHGNLHPIDIQFWFYNIRENVRTRLAAWRREHLK